MKDTQSFQRPPLDALTSIRFFAAVHVVIYHFVTFVPEYRASAPAWIRRLVACGPLEVGLFFVLSGFILTYNYLGLEGSLRATRRDFWKVRFARIYPMYLIAMLAYLPVAAGRYLSGTGLSVIDVGPGPTFAIGGIVTLFLIQAWVFVFAAWNPPSWSVSAEAFFYFTFPWIAPRMMRLNTRQLMNRMSALWLLSLAPATYFLVAILGQTSKQTKELWEVGLETFPLLRISSFLIGIGTGVFYLRRREADPARYPALVNLTLGVLIVVCAILPEWTERLLESALTPLLAILVYLLAFRRGWISRFLSHRWAVELGEASYAMYLIHVPLWNFFAHWPNLYGMIFLGHFPVGQARPGIATEWRYDVSIPVFAGYFVVLIVVSLLATHYIEKPVRYYVRRRLMRSSERLVLTAVTA